MMRRISGGEEEEYDERESLRTACGSYRRKHHVRAIFRSLALILLVGTYYVYNEYVDGITTPTTTRTTTITNAANNNNNNIINNNNNGSVRTREEKNTPLDERVSKSVEQAGSERIAERKVSRRLDDGLEPCDGVSKAEPVWTLVFYILGIVYMFLALAIVCDEFFVPALEEMASERHLNLTLDIAGATLMAAGGSAPELFTSLFGTFQESEVGFGTIVGSATFNVLFVIAMCSLLSKEVLKLTWWPLFRDSAYYSVGLIVLTIFVGVVSESEIELWEAIVLFIMYLGYIGIMAANRNIYHLITGKQLSEDGRIIESDQETFQNGSPSPPSDSLDNEHAQNDDSRQPVSELDTSLRSVHATSTNTSPIDFRWPGTFRAGVLKLLRDPDSWVETAGVGIVSKMAGTVDHVFRTVDKNGDGEVDKEELGMLFEMLDCHVTPRQLEDVYKELDKDKDGLINEKEFTDWYLHSEERIKSMVKQTFDKFDEDKSGAIDRHEVRKLLEKLEPRVTDQDIDDALKAMYKEGNTEEITFDEFADWYVSSLVYQKQLAEQDDDVGEFCDSLKPPCPGSFYEIFTYIFLFPIVFCLTLTIPDTRRPGCGKFCYISFFVSICWIGAFSFFMVDWAEIVGNTVGIPSVVMGLTFLAAGTSVPDLLSSVIVARRGEGDMAVSSSIGSNIFDILVGLPIPWIIFTSWPDTPSTVVIGSSNIWAYIMLLLGMLIFIVITIHFQGWELTKALGGMMFLFYIIFLVVVILLELPFETCSSS